MLTQLERAERIARSDWERTDELRRWRSELLQFGLNRTGPAPPPPVYWRGAILIAAALVLVSGCEESAKRSVRVRPPASATPPASALPGPLPVETRRPDLAVLMPQAPNGVEILIQNAEAAYRSGEQNYKAGHLSKARRDFDQALDLLLSSGFDLEADPRLQSAYDRLVEAVQGYEMAAFQEGDGFSEQRTEPAPIDEIADMAFPVDPRLRDRAEKDLRTVSHDLPLTVNDHVLSYLNFFQTSRGRAIVEAGLRRSGRYREMIAGILREEGLPQDLIYLAQAESAFQPMALSRAGARGIWQFMAYRGKEYGLQRSWWVDERQDPEKATRAAARHLRDLYHAFGDWYLVMAAYNSGPGNVQRGIERTGYADFWELYRRNVLPRETRNYVPIIVALALMAKNADRYGLQTEPETPVRTEVVRPGHPIDLRLVAETIDVDVDTLRSLNPQLLRMATPASPEFGLCLPAGTAERFLSEIAVIPPEKWVSWRRHRVEEGESLSALARRYRVTPNAIADANGLAIHAELRVGDKLIIPAAARLAQGKLIRYRVQRWDTLETIADQFSVSPADLKKWNGLRSGRVSRGMRLRIYPGGRPVPAAVKRSRGSSRAPRAAKRPAAETRGKTTNSSKTAPASQGLRAKRGGAVDPS